MTSNEQNDSAQYLIFILDGKYFAFDVLKTREVLTMTPITPIPGTPEFMSGVLNLRGSVVPVMDLRKKFRMKVSDYTDDTSIIIVEASAGEEVIVMGARVDAVKGVRRFENSELEPPPKVGMKLSAELIHAIGKTESEFILILNVDTCRLYELYSAYPQGDGSWWAGSGAIYDLASNALRPAGWTSADAAGLPILPGLVRYDEVLTGRITHALRFTVPETRTDYVWPARHFASEDDNPNLPPMGQRFRLRANYDISGFDPFLQVILRAMKEYGIILADNGSPWYISGVPDERWNNDLLHDLDVLTGADFEAVDSSNLMIDPDSGACRQPTAAYLPSILR